jgi:hypothetical protein
MGKSFAHSTWNDLYSAKQASCTSFTTPKFMAFMTWLETRCFTLVWELYSYLAPRECALVTTTKSLKRSSKSKSCSECIRTTKKANYRSCKNRSLDFSLTSFTISRIWMRTKRSDLFKNRYYRLQFTISKGADSRTFSNTWYEMTTYWVLKNI